MQAAQLLRRYHLAVAGFPTQKRLWRRREAAIEPGEVVCHHDFGPHNTVYRDGRIVGLIDWDFAAPALPIRDLAFSALFWVPLFAPEHAAVLDGVPTDRQPERLALFLDAYGLESPAGFVQAVVDRLADLVAVIEDGAASGEPAFQRMLAEGHARMYDVSRRHVQRIAPVLERAIGL